MADKRKAQPAFRGRAVCNTVGADGVNSAFDHPHNSTKPSACQVATDGGVSFKSVGDFVPRDDESVARPR